MRKVMTAGAAVALALTTLVFGPAVPNAEATKNYCADTYPTTTGVPNPFVVLAVEHRDTPSDLAVGICYGDTPYGSPALLLGGYVGVTVTNVSPGRWDVNFTCQGDSSPTTFVVLNCTTTQSTTTTVTTSPSVTITGSGWTRVNSTTLTLGPTGANAGSPGVVGGTTPTVTYGGTCATVHGVTLVPCTTAALDATVAANDVPTATAGGTTSTCLLTVGPTCLLYAPRAFVQAFNDPSATEVEVLSTKVVSDPGRICIGFGC